LSTTLPDSLSHFGPELEEAIGRAVRRRRGTRLAAGVASASAVAIVAVFVLIVPHHVGRYAEPRWAGQAIEQAAAVLTPTPNTVFHVALTGTRTKPSGQTVRWSQDNWWQEGPPYGGYSLTRVDGEVLEERNDGNGGVYDATHNVIYRDRVRPTANARYRLVHGVSPRSLRVRVYLDGQSATIPVTEAQAVALRKGRVHISVGVGFTVKGHQVLLPSVGPMKLDPSSSEPEPESLQFAAELRALLATGVAHVRRTTTAQGRPAIEIAWSKARIVYYVDPSTYAPIELIQHLFDGQGTSRLRFTAYQTFSLAGHRRLLRIRVPANARIEYSPAMFWHAVSLLLTN
jgi:hypothetical protein